MYTKTQSGWSKHFDFILIDLISIYLSFFIAYFIRNGIENSFSNFVYRDFGIMLFFFHIVLVFLFEPYSGVLKRGYLQEFKKSFNYVTIYLMSLLVYFFIRQNSSNYSRIFMVIFWIISIIIVFINRLFLKIIIKYTIKESKNAHHLLLITEKAFAEKNINTICKNIYTHNILDGIIITDENMQGKMIQNIPVVANFENMLEYVRINVVDTVLIDIKSEWNEDTVNQLVNMGITVHINLNELLSNLNNCSLEHINGYNVITTCINTVTDRQIFLKRTMDIIGSIVGMIICGIAFIFVSPIIYLQSPGPIFFTQTRIGMNGRKFKIYKFRTMYMDAEERKKELMCKNEMNGLMFKITDDPRIFPFGHILRKTSIDELPQFFNVFKGDMSLVGTRPPTVDEYERYDIAHKSRLATKPGITGLWQVSGRSDITDFNDVVKLDNEYIRNWSLIFDIKIIFKTIIVVLFGKGAA